MTYGHEQHSYAGVAYDGLWAIAVTLNKTEEMLQTERNCSLRNLSACNPAVSHTNLTGIFFDFMNETDFPGVSVCVCVCVRVRTRVCDVCVYVCV